MWDPENSLDINVLYLRDYAKSLTFIASNACSPDSYNEFNDMVAILRPLEFGLEKLYDEMAKIGEEAHRKSK